MLGTLCYACIPLQAINNIHLCTHSSPTDTLYWDPVYQQQSMSGKQHSGGGFHPHQAHHKSHMSTEQGRADKL